MKPILFNTEMVRAILEGRKTVTRRVVKGCALGCLMMKKAPEVVIEEYAPYLVNDILYVRETWGYIDFAGENNGYVYKASDNGELWEKETNGWRWKPSIHMPKEAARLFLRVKSVRVERLQDITRDEMLKEGIIDYCEKCRAAFGCDLCGNESAVEDEFFHLWNGTLKRDQIKTYGWYANPYVWVIEFELLPCSSIAEAEKLEV